MCVFFSESLGSSLSVALPSPLSSSEPVYHSSSAAMPSLTPSLGANCPANPPLSTTATSTTSSSAPSTSSHFSSVGGSYEGTMPPHNRLAFSQSKDPTGPVMVSKPAYLPFLKDAVMVLTNWQSTNLKLQFFCQNGLNGVRTSAALDSELPTTALFLAVWIEEVHLRYQLAAHKLFLCFSASSASSTPKPESPSVNTNGPSASSHLTPTLSPHSSTTLSSLTQDLPSANQLNSLNRSIKSRLKCRNFRRALPTLCFLL